MARTPEVGAVVLRPYGSQRGTYRVSEIDEEGVSLEGITAQFHAWVNHDSYRQDFKDVKADAKEPPHV